MGGIASVLRRCREDAVLVAPCDMIFLSEASLEKLKSTYEETGKPVLFEGEFLPLPASIPKVCCPGWNGIWNREITGLRVCGRRRTM